MQYRTVWILRGDIAVNQTNARELSRTPEEDFALLLDSYRAHSGRLDTKHYTLGINKAPTSKGALLRILSDPDTAGIVWHSHSDSSGTLYAAGRATVSSQDVAAQPKSPRLAFVSLLGCRIARAKSRWVKALALDRFSDGPQRLAASGNEVSLYQGTNIVTGRTQDSWVKRFAERHANQAEAIQHYHFPDLIDLLPRVRS